MALGSDPEACRPEEQVSGSGHRVGPGSRQDLRDNRDDERREFDRLEILGRRTFLTGVDKSPDWNTHREPRLAQAQA